MTQKKKKKETWGTGAGGKIGDYTIMGGLVVRKDKKKKNRIND